MKYVKRACCFKMEAEKKLMKIKRVMTKPFIYKIIEVTGYITSLSILVIHIYIFTSICKPSQETV